MNLTHARADHSRSCNEKPSHDFQHPERLPAEPISSRTNCLNTDSTSSGMAKICRKSVTGHRVPEEGLIPTMKLSHFITSHMEHILVEWETFAKTLRPASDGLTAEALRDHGRQILETIAREIDIHESARQKDDKSRGLVLHNTATSAADEHGAERQEHGFTMLQLISEFRLLRAIVLKLWMPKISQSSEETVREILRFNEAIDKALAESALTYSLQAISAGDASMVIKEQDINLVQLAMDGVYVLSMADLHMNLLTHQVSRANRAVTLQPREFNLLEYMLRNANRALKRDLILKNVWGYQFDPHTNLIDVHISKLRRKIDLNSPLKLVRTVRNIGYMLTDQES